MIGCYMTFNGIHGSESLPLGLSKIQTNKISRYHSGELLYNSVHVCTYLHSHIDLVHSIDSIDGGVQHFPGLNIIVHGLEAHVQEANHLRHVAAHGAELVQEPVTVT